jgi:hypothetical protein
MVVLVVLVVKHVGLSLMSVLHLEVPWHISSALGSALIAFSLQVLYHV